jgi:hypothetical protein
LEAVWAREWVHWAASVVWAVSVAPVAALVEIYSAD